MLTHTWHCDYTVSYDNAASVASGLFAVFVIPAIRMSLKVNDQ